ncbi:hypothetical protein BDN72DRAFT_859456 [Pluteus cervinus]|uniref:Uncharacterized protein n=1 Tax=Pluteus cervinus TaxID=181527 RepID=A0ACD3ANF9_9AGAR|nr:hypothetical protein BDN72DRAFT_859456 [Pluteus cervinus]
MVSHWSKDPHTAEQQRIKKQIRKLHRRLNRLKSRLNDLIPINQLLPELLTRIFFFLQRDLQTAGTAYYRWTSVMHVCRHWRNLTLEGKSLWSGVNYTTSLPQSPWAAFSLDQSKPRSLDVVMKTTSLSPDYALTHTIIQDLSRMRTLHFSLDLDTELRHLSDANRVSLADLVQNFGKEAPLLEEFSMEGPNPFVKANQNPTPTVLFGGHAPRLASIDIWNFYFRFTSMPFTNLTVLKICYARSHPGGLSFRTFFEVLRANRVKILKMYYSVFQEDDLSPRDHSPIPLPSLSVLDFRGTPSQCRAFLCNVVVPPKCEITIKGRIADTQGTQGTPDPQGFIDETVSSIHQCLTHLIRVDVVVSDRLDGVTLDLWMERQHRAQSAPKQGWGPNPLVQISYWLPRTQEEVDWFVFPMSIPLPNVWLLGLRSSASSWTPPSGNDAMMNISMLSSLTHVELEGPFITLLSTQLTTHLNSFERLNSLEIIHGEDVSSTLEPLYAALVKRGAALLRVIGFAASGKEGDDEFIKWKGLLTGFVGGG